MKINKRGVKLLFSVAAIIVVIGAIAFSKNIAKATGDKPNLNITLESVTKTSGLVNEEVEATYRITPEPLDIADVNVIQNKEIVLVLDTSGSMNNPISGSYSRIRALKSAAINFVEKLSTESNVKIGIVTYSFYSNYDKNKLPLTASTNKTAIEDKINSIKAEGATNIGDGIRCALGMLNNGSNAKKYVILMSDGEPTAFSYSNIYTKKPYSSKYYYDGYNYYKDYMYYYDYYNTLDTNPPRYYNYYYGTDDPYDYAMTYATSMATKTKDLNYCSYVIAYSEGSSSDKMKQLATSSNGKYYSALDANTINNVYSDIANQIKADYSVAGANFNFTLPEGIEYMSPKADLFINGSNYIQQLPNIIYRLNSNRTQYIADSFTISFKFLASKSGSYTLGSGWNISYNGINGQVITKAMPVFNYNASKLNVNLTLNKSIPGYTDRLYIGEQNIMRYSITPSNLVVNYTRKPKQIVLAIDSTYSNKSGISSFIDKFSRDSDVTFAVIYYGKGATLWDINGDGTKYFTNSTDPNLKNTINNIKSEAGSNIGEALRKSMFILNNKLDVEREVVIFADRDPQYYSYIKNSDGAISYYQEINNLNGVTDSSDTDILIYGTDSVKAKEYLDIICGKISEAKNLDISIFTAGDSSNANSLLNISAKFGNSFVNILNQNDLNNLYLITNSDLSLNGRIQDSVSDFGMYEADSVNLNRNLNIYYKYDAIAKSFIGTPVTIDIPFTIQKQGVFNLNAGMLYFKDLDGIELNRSFNSLSITAVDKYLIKQGFFFKQQSTQNGLPGESYISSVNIANPSVTLNTYLNMGALVKTSGQSTNLKININSSKNGDINIIELNAKVYKIGDDNSLNILNITPIIDGNSISLSLPSDSIKNTYYIINYGYKIQAKDEQNFKTYYGDGGAQIKNSCSIIGDNVSNDYNYTVVNFPDLF